MYLHIFLLILCLLSTGCVPILDATSEAPLNRDPGERSFGRFIDDEQLETIIKVNLRKQGEDVKQANINVSAFNNIVLLTGQAPSTAVRQRAGDVARQVYGVRQVFNEIQVQGNISVLSQTNDTWLTTKVKSVLIASSETDASRIRVITEQGTVYLMGLLTRQEARTAAQTTSRVGGVQKVVKAVEYIEKR